MLFTEFLDSIQGTEQEARFLEVLAKIRNEIKQVTRVPFVGKLFEALVALDGYASIAAFKQDECYENVQGWDVSVNLDKGLFSIYPGAEMREKIFKFIAIVGAVKLLLWLWIRSRRRKEQWYGKR
jgi:hypothetical protein